VQPITRCINQFNLTFNLQKQRTIFSFISILVSHLYVENSWTDFRPKTGLLTSNKDYVRSQFRSSNETDDDGGFQCFPRSPAFWFCDGVVRWSKRPSGMFSNRRVIFCTYDFILFKVKKYVDETHFQPISSILRHLN